MVIYIGDKQERLLSEKERLDGEKKRRQEYSEQIKWACFASKRG